MPIKDIYYKGLFESKPLQLLSGNRNVDDITFNDIKCPIRLIVLFNKRKRFFYYFRKSQINIKPENQFIDIK